MDIHDRGVRRPATVLVPSPAATLLLKAPQLSSRVFPVSRMDVVRNLDNGHVDLILGWFGDLPERMRRRCVLVEPEALVVRVGHSLTTKILAKNDCSIIRRRGSI